MRAFVGVVSGRCQLLKALYLECLWVGVDEVGVDEVVVVEDAKKMGAYEPLDSDGFLLGLR